MRERRVDDVPGGNIALAVIVGGLDRGARAGISITASFLSSDSMNNYVHVWGIARDLWHHGHLPWRMPVLGHGDAYAYPYGFANWTTAALAVARCSATGASRCGPRSARSAASPRRSSRSRSCAGAGGRRRCSRTRRSSRRSSSASRRSRGAPRCCCSASRRWRRNRPLARGGARRPRPGHARRDRAADRRAARRACCPFVPDRRRLLRWYARVAADRAPGRRRSCSRRPATPTRRRATGSVNFIGTLGPRICRRAPADLRAGAPNGNPRALRRLALVVSLERERRVRAAAQRRLAMARVHAQPRTPRRSTTFLRVAGVRARRDVSRAAQRGRHQARPLPRAPGRWPARLGAVPGEHGECIASRAARVRAAALRSPRRLR